MQLDHADRVLSTEPSPSERDNALRYRDRPAARAAGHVESHFLKANSPDGTRALWLKHTLLVPPQRPEAAVAEVWAIAFAARGRRKQARKASFAIGAADFSDAPFAIRLPCAHLAHGHALGSIGDGPGGLAWTLRFDMPEQAFRPFRLAGMYTGPFPRSKSLTPGPDLRVHGSFLAFGERWDVDGWRGAQGHNWGVSHAHAYAWVHANAWREEEGATAPLDGVWLEALTGQVRMAGLVTPWLSVAGVALEGLVLRFDGLRALCSRRVRIDTRSYALELEQAGARLAATFRAEADQFVGLRYQDPDGSALACLNSKLAEGRLTLSYKGRTWRLRTEQAALELGTRSPDHGIPLLA